MFEPKSIMAGDDMAFFLENIPGAFFFLGSGLENVGPLHNSRFDFDESVLSKGVKMYLRIAEALLK